MTYFNSLLPFGLLLEQRVWYTGMSSAKGKIRFDEWAIFNPRVNSEHIVGTLVSRNLTFPVNNSPFPN